MTYLIDYRKKRKVEITVRQRGTKLYLRFPYNETIKNEIRGCEESSWHPDDKCWSILAPEYSKRNANILGFLSNGEWPNSTKDPFYHYTKPVEAYKTNRSIYKHQQELIDLFLTRKRYYVAHDMGLGKTLAAIIAIEILKNKYYINDLLIWVSGPQSAIDSWKYELRKWKADFQPQLFTSSSIEDQLEKYPVPPRIWIADEAVDFKNPSAKRSQYALQLSQLMARAYDDDYYILAMSGTPSPKDPADWWNQIEILCPGFIQQKSANQMRRELADMAQMEGPHGVYNKVLGWKKEKVAELYTKLKPIVNVKFKKDCLDLPPKIYQQINLDCSAQTLTTAKLIIETSTSVMEATQKLCQLSDGFQYHKDNIVTRLYSPKDQQLANDLQELLLNEQTRVVIWSSYNESLTKIIEICHANGWNTIRYDGTIKWQTNIKLQGEGQEMFQDYNLDIPIAFVGNCDSGGQGLTLNKAEEAIYFSNSNNYRSRAQSEDRIYRIGTTKARIRDYFHLPTDRRIYELLMAKKELMSLTLGELKDVLKN